MECNFDILRMRFVSASVLQKCAELNSCRVSLPVAQAPKKDHSSWHSMANTAQVEELLNQQISTAVRFSLTLLTSPVAN